MNATTSSPFPPRRLSARAASDDVTTWSSGNDNSVNRSLRRVAASATPEYRFGRARSRSNPEIPRAIENRILVRRTFCRSAVNAERTRDRTTAARSRGRQPAASRHSPRSSEPRRRSAAATACWTGRRTPTGFSPKPLHACTWSRSGSPAASVALRRAHVEHQGCARVTAALRAGPRARRHDGDERPGRPRRFNRVATSRWLPFARIFRRSLSNDLPFSGERQGRVRAYHGREESRAPARGVAAHARLRADRCGVQPLQRRVGQGDERSWFSSKTPSRSHPVRLRLRRRVRGSSKGPRRTQRTSPHHRDRRRSPRSHRHDGDERRCRPHRLDRVATSRWLPSAHTVVAICPTIFAFSGGAQAPSAATRG